MRTLTVVNYLLAGCAGALAFTACSSELNSEYEEPVRVASLDAQLATCTTLKLAGAKASGTDGFNNPSNAIDGKLSTRWSGLGMGSWLDIDLGAVKSVSGASIAWYRGDERRVTFAISVSNDGAAYSPVYTGTTSGKTDSYETVSFDSVAARHVRVTVTANTQGDWASINEVKLCAGSSSTPTPPPTSTSTNPPALPDAGSSESALDKFGIKKLYPTKDGREWYVNMADPKSDPRFKNLPSMALQSDGSWQVSADQVRMEAWSPDNQKWLNVEITEYAKVITSANNLLQMYSRGGHHSDTRPCEGSAYKSRLYLDGRAGFVKEICHPAYTDNRARILVTSRNLIGRWVGHKMVIRNVVQDGRTIVRLESYIDEDVDMNGALVIKNNWRLMTSYEDRDNTWTSTSYATECAGCAYKNGDIMAGPGGTATANLAAWRSDQTRWNWKYLSVREIETP